MSGGSQIGPSNILSTGSAPDVQKALQSITGNYQKVASNANDGTSIFLNKKDESKAVVQNYDGNTVIKEGGTSLSKLSDGTTNVKYEDMNQDGVIDGGEKNPSLNKMPDIKGMEANMKKNAVSIRNTPGATEYILSDGSRITKKEVATADGKGTKVLYTGNLTGDITEVTAEDSDKNGKYEKVNIFLQQKDK